MTSYLRRIRILARFLRHVGGIKQDLVDTIDGDFLLLHLKVFSWKKGTYDPVKLKPYLEIPEFIDFLALGP